MSSPTPTVSLTEKLDSAHELRALIRRHREHADEARVSWHTRWWKPWPGSASSAPWSLPVLGGEEWPWPTSGCGSSRSSPPSMAQSAGMQAWAVPRTRSSVAGSRLTSDRPCFVRTLSASSLVQARFHGDCTTCRRGYHVTGCWQFGSGSPHASWFVAGYTVEGEATRLGPMAWGSAKDVEIIDTRFVGGMRGTGSQDFAVQDLFVPTAYTLNAADDVPLHPGPLYRLPLVLTLCSSLGPLTLGIARGAIDCFIELMATKVDRFTGTALRERLTVQERVAKAEAARARPGRFSMRWSTRSGGQSSRGAVDGAAARALPPGVSCTPWPLVPRQSIWCTMRLARVRSLLQTRLSVSSGTPTSPPNTDARPPKSCIRYGHYRLPLTSLI